MGTHLHTTIKKNGRKYYYFRPPPEIQWRFSKRVIRLSDDRAEAELEAAVLAGSIPADNDREPTKGELTAARRMLNNANGRAIKRKLTVTITVPQIIAMMRAQQYCCHVTLLPFDLNWRAGKSARRNAYAPSLDRLDNAKGYTPDNCRMVLAAVNYAMNEWGLEVYREIAKATFLHGSREQMTHKASNRVRFSDKPV